jgi:hypothetical protein
VQTQRHGPLQKEQQLCGFAAEAEAQAAARTHPARKQIRVLLPVRLVAAGGRVAHARPRAVGAVDAETQAFLVSVVGEDLHAPRELVGPVDERPVRGALWLHPVVVHIHILVAGAL